eukprot:349736-Chlamydomonas_euryale.AAC.3
MLNASTTKSSTGPTWPGSACVRDVCVERGGTAVMLSLLLLLWLLLLLPSLWLLLLLLATAAVGSVGGLGGRF